MTGPGFAVRMGRSAAVGLLIVGLFGVAEGSWTKGLLVLAAAAALGAVVR